MAVLNDPFPHDEVTGLAAFENLPPVSSIAASDEAEDLPENAAEPAAPRHSGIRRDPTLPLGRRTWAKPHRAEPDAPAAARASTTDDDLVAYTETDLPLAAPREADHLFDDSALSQWETDGATRVSAPEPEAPASSTELHMDWDEEEPPTQMQPGAMFEASALSGLPPSAPDPDPMERAAMEFAPASESGESDAWDEPDESTQLYSRARVFSQAMGIAGAAQTMSGGQPSPFPAIPPNRTLGPVQGGHLDFNALMQPHVPERLFDALRVGNRRAWALVGGVVAGLVALVLIVRALSAGPGVGSVVVPTQPADAKLVIDGKLVPGTSSPYSLTELAPGSHTLVASKPGYTDYQNTFIVAARETKTLPAVELARSEVGFDVRSTPTAAAVWVDGQATERNTPTRMTGITPGIHRLQLKKEGYADFELQLFVPEGTVLQLPDMALVELPASGERERTDRGADKSARAARNAEHDDADDEAAAPRRSWRSARAAVARDESDEPAQPRRSWRSARSHETAESSPAASQDPAPVAAAPANSATGRYGTLRINSRPWSQVLVDGRNVGNTPLHALLLSSGQHKVQLVNQAMGMTKTIQVSIAPGETVTRVLNLTD